MIYVNRIDKPNVLVRNEVKWTEAIKSATTAESKEKAIGKYQHEEIKDQLSKMFNGKCAYCESFIENVDYGDIEHFRPKAKFPELAVTWDNLLLACKKCNGTAQKGDNWPSNSEGGPLVNPSEEQPEDFFEFLFDEATLVSIVRPKNIRGTTSERIYGLNKHLLLKDRNLFVRKLIFIAKRYNSDTQAKAIIDDAIKDDGEYAAFARMVMSKYVK